MLLQILQEECAEVIQAVSKINRFGIDGNYPDGTSNTDQLDTEMCDVGTLIGMVIIEIQKTHGYKLRKIADADAINAKILRVEKSLEDSKTKGALKDE